jgi:hypothetical protein
MRATLVILIVHLASIALADDFKTIDGKEYKDVKVSRVASVIVNANHGVM